LGSLELDTNLIVACIVGSHPLGFVDPPTQVDETCVAAPSAAHRVHLGVNSVRTALAVWVGPPAALANSRPSGRPGRWD